MSIQLDYNDPRYTQAAAEILRRHDNSEPEANITSAVRDFLILTGLVLSQPRNSSWRNGTLDTGKLMMGKRQFKVPSIPGMD